MSNGSNVQKKTTTTTKYTEKLDYGEQTMDMHYSYGE